MSTAQHLLVSDIRTKLGLGRTPLFVTEEENAREQLEQPHEGYIGAFQLVTAGMMELLGRNQSQVKMLYEQFHSSAVQDQDQEQKSQNEETIYKTADGLAINRLVGRRPVCSKVGLVGLAPGATEPGDFICVLLDFAVPFVPRKHGDGWNLVGECLGPGIMEGEALEGLELSDPEDPGDVKAPIELMKIY
jgi:hypothetical protein